MAERLTVGKKAKGITVEVTPEIIADAEQRSSSHCMIAEAIRRANPRVGKISVDLATIRFTDLEKRKRYIFLTPQTAQQALVRFDRGEPTEPFVFRTGNAVQVLEVLTGQRRTPRLLVRPQGTNLLSPPTIVGGAPIPSGPLAGSSDVRGDVPARGRVKQSRTKTGEFRATIQESTSATMPANDENPALRKGRGLTRRYGMKQLKP